MRVLALETSTRRGSAALLEGSRVLATAEHEELNAHAERMLGLVEGLLERCGWSRASIERVAVGTGPGSFVGLRVGIALAQGLALGLDVPVVGVSSLRAMAGAVPDARREPRLALLDARRNEVFAAAYAADGRELLAPRAVARASAAELVRELGAPIVVGAVAAELALDAELLRGTELDLPHAQFVGLLSESLRPEEFPAVPQYCRSAGATLPDLPPSPFSIRSGN
ncbi:MAG TPA: tRNA (adenosine(37)-N6)-threonylcarbamoyltransferase complex dimerization subunit type 1 TsaB [Polyangiaceae bacterium]|nr:tRNA (adenosine(37)-N6)-threonylcarbamoyltransferase complex dimerization subunit type 1 TsaB [Polyangiaceae bacterium]